MKPLLLFVCMMMLGGGAATAQTVCNSSGNLIIFSNYDGGTLNINVDVNIPNLKIGVVSYEAVAINITGTFAGNVTGVRYAGYNNMPNNNCTPNITTTTITGAPTTATTAITVNPPSPLTNTNGYTSIICMYGCSNTTNQGGCNTPDQITTYFAQQFPGATFRFHKTQYNCWSSTQTVSGAGNCCLTGPQPLSVNAPDVSVPCFGQCNATITATGVGGTPPYAYTWYGGPLTNSWINRCPGTYYVAVTDAASNTKLDTVVVTQPPPVNVAVTQNGAVLTASATGAAYQWVRCMGTTYPSISGAIAQTYTATQNGQYAVIVTQSGCSDTSNCYTITTVGIDGPSLVESVRAYPNPLRGDIMVISTPDRLHGAAFVLTDAVGHTIIRGTLVRKETEVHLPGLVPGIYLLRVAGQERAIPLVR